MDQNQVGGRGGNRTFDKAGLTIGTDVAKFKTAATVDFTINGYMYNKGATDNIAFSSGHTALGNNEVCMFAVWLNTGGSFSTTQGPVVSQTDVTNGKNAVRMPDVIDDKALVGLIKVKTAIATFTPGTTNLNATNVTNTYYDVSLMPVNVITA